MADKKLPFKQLDFNQVFGKIQVSSVLKDMIYVLLFFMVFVLLLAALRVDAWIIVVSFIFLGGFLIFFGYCYNWLMRNDRNALKSETYQLERQRIEMMGSQSKEVSAEAIEAEPVIEKPKERDNKKQLEMIVNKGGIKK